jgi:O-antigen/teichoic acid export membrane protein
MDDAGFPEPAWAPATLRRRFIVGSAWVLVGKTASTFASFVVSALLARILRPAEFGSYVLASALVTVSATVAQLGLKQSTVRLVAEAIATGRTDRARAAIRTIVGMTVVGAVVAGGILAVGAGRLIAERLFGSALLADISWLIAAWVVTMTVQQVLAEIFRGLQDLRLATLFEGLASGVMSAAAFAGLWLTSRAVGLALVVGVSVVASVASVILASVLLAPRVRSMGSGSRLGAGRVLSTAWPFLVTGVVLFAVNSGTDVWIIGANLGQSDVALYGAAVRLVGLMASPMLILLSVAPPIVAELNARGDRAKLEQAVRAATAVVAVPSLLAFLALLALGEVILSAVYGPFYRQADAVTIVLGAGYLVNVLAGPCGVTLMMTGHQRAMMTITIASGVLSVAGALVLVQPLGMIGVAISTSVGLVVQNVLMVRAVRRRVGIWTFADLSRRAIGTMLSSPPKGN